MRYRIIPISIPNQTVSVPCFVDDEDYDRISQMNWNLRKSQDTWYARTTVGQKACEKKRHVYMHRMLLPAESHKEVDHINRNGLDNRKANLRACSRAENARNSRKRSDNTSGYKGVCWSKKSKKWRAQIRLNNKKYCIGYSDNIWACALAYRVAAKEMHKDYASVV